MTDDLKELLRLYGLEQECMPSEQAARAGEFKQKVKEVALKHRLDHWKISAHVRICHDKLRRAEEKRLGLSKGLGLAPE